MALLLLGGLVAAATILGGVYALCLWRFRRSYNRLSESDPGGSTEKLVTSTEVSISADYEGRQRGDLLDNEDNEQSGIDAERKEKGGKDQLQVGGGIKDESESTESSEVGDQESKPLLTGSGPKEAAKYGIDSEVNARLTLPSHSDNLPTTTKKEKHAVGFVDALLETDKQKPKSLETSTTEDITTIEPVPVAEASKPRKPAKDEQADVISEIEKQKVEPLIDFTSSVAPEHARDGVTDTLLLPAQTSEAKKDKNETIDILLKIESEKSSSPQSVKTTSALTTTEESASKESIADKLNALFQPKLQKETEDLNENTQTFPPMKRSPLPHIAPKPAPRKSRPTDSSPRPASSILPGGAPPVAAKPVGQARKQAFSPSAVPVLPMAFGKGGFVPPALRRKAEVSNGERGQVSMFNGSGFGARGSEGGAEEPSSFDEVCIIQGS